MSAGFAGQSVVGFADLSIDLFLEVQSKWYNQILNLIDHIAYGLHSWYKINLQRNLPKTYFPSSWLSDKSGVRELSEQSHKLWAGLMFQNKSWGTFPSNGPQPRPISRLWSPAVSMRMLYQGWCRTLFGLFCVCVGVRFSAHLNACSDAIPVSDTRIPCAWYHVSFTWYHWSVFVTLSDQLIHELFAVTAIGYR